MIKTIAFLICVGIAGAQSTGTVQATGATAPVPAVLGKVVATTPTISCTVAGNAVPATSVTVACTVNGSVLPTYTMPMAASHAYTFQQNFDQDAVTFVVQSDASKVISVSATANGNTAPAVKF